MTLAMLTACATPQERAEDRESLLAAAGFAARPANTPARLTELQTLPPNRLVQQPHSDGFLYVYADPLVCKCLYIGDQAAFGRYQQERLQRQLANEQVMAAQMNDQAWDWGPWGPGF